MFDKGQKRPEVFISYSWTNIDHEEWVVNLAKRLMEESGIIVTLDKWDLKEGQDKYVFMESMVTSENIDKVLIICDEGYMNRADQRKGGVGEETTIITKKVYEDVKQEKFIPIVATRSDKGEAYIPAYISTRIYIDLSDSDSYEENYDKLVRNIVGAPLYKKPSLGDIPTYLFEDASETKFTTTQTVRKMKGLMERQPSRIPILAKEFTENLVDSIKTLKIHEFKNNEEYDQEVFETINSSEQLKDDYVEALNVLLGTDKLSEDYLIELFEEMYVVVSDELCDFVGNDAVKFIFNELLLYSVAILNRNYKYDILASFLAADFMDMSIFRRNVKLTFNDFYYHLKSLDYRNKRLNANRISIHADLLKQRAGNLKNDILIADLLLYYIDGIATPNEYFTWFPITHIYLEKHNIRFLTKLKSRNYFERIKHVFKVDTKDEFIEKASSMKSANYQRSFKNTPPLFEFVSQERICSEP